MNPSRLTACATIFAAILLFDACKPIQIECDSFDPGCSDGGVFVWGITLMLGQMGIPPNQISGLQNWYTADSLGLSDGNPVNTWYDLSGNGRDLTTATAPIYRDSILNGYPAVQFTPNQYMTDLGATPTSDLVTVMVVARMSRVGANPQLISHTTGADNGWNLYGHDTLNYRFSFAARGLSAAWLADWAVNSFDWDPTQFYLIGSFRYGGITAVFINGFPAIDIDPERSIDYGGAPELLVGAKNPGAIGAYLTGEIAEIVVYHSAVGEYERSGLQRYFAQKYGLDLFIDE